MKYGCVGWVIITITVYLFFVIGQPSPIQPFGNLLVCSAGMWSLVYAGCVFKVSALRLRQIGKSPFVGILISLFTFTFLFAVIEYSARMILDMSNSYTLGAMQQIWNYRHWHQNSLGYRDVEPCAEEFTNVLLVGDSFIAGLGIEEFEDTIGRQLQNRLGGDFCVNIAGEPGDNTRDELRHFTRHPTTPDIVIWSHLPNDIAWLNQQPPAPISRSALGVAEWIAGRLYITDYLVVHTIRAGQPAREDTLWRDENLVEQHRLYLQGIIASIDVRVIGMIWIEDSGDVSELFNEWIDMRDVVDMWASFLDPHPNEEAAALAAERLAQWIRPNN